MIKKHFIHVGFSKSATTTFQRFLYDKHSKIISLEKFNRELYALFSKKCRIHMSPNYDDPIFYEVKKILYSLDDDFSFIYSDNNCTEETFINELVARNLYALMPNAHIIFTMRNQFSAIESAYSAHGRELKAAPRPYHGKPVTFDHWLEFCLERWERCMLSQFDYMSTISIYEKIFGPDKLHIFVYENFVSEKQKFLKKLSDVLLINLDEATDLLAGKSENIRPTGRKVWYDSFRTRYLRGIPITKIIPGGLFLKRCLEKFLNEGRSYNPKLSNVWRSKLTKVYAPGNNILNKKYNLELDKHHYPL